MEPMQEILELEKGFWTDGAAYYRQHLDDECLVAFSSMARAMSKDDVAKTVEKGGRFENPKLDVKGFIQPMPAVALLTYEARASRKDGETYSALVSSGYVKRDGEWKMAFHTQAPLDAGEERLSSGH